MGKCPFCGVVMPQTAKAPKSGGVYGCANCLNPCIAIWENSQLACRPIDGFPDLRHEAVPPVMVAHRVLHRLEDALEKLPVLPEIPRRIMVMANDPLANLQEIAHVINGDGVMAMKVLRLANSAFYASTQEITSLEVACFRLGLKMIVKVAHAIAGQDAYRAVNGPLREHMDKTWRHAIAVAQCAGEIGMLLPGLPTDDAFLAGLIHDVGRVVLFRILMDLYKEKKLPEAVSVDDCLAIVDGYRAVAGLHVIQRWGLPLQFRLTTLCSSKPESVPLPDYLPMTCVVALADTMADALGYDSGEPSTYSVGEHPAAETLELSPSSLYVLQNGLKDRIDPLIEALQD